MANFPSSAVAFPARNDGETIFSQHVNALQDEVTAIETALVGGTLLVPQIIGSAVPTLLFDSGILAKGRAFAIDGRTYLTQNLSYDGVGFTWNADDVSAPSMMLSVRGGDLYVSFSPIGPNPRTLADVAVFIGASGAIRERGRAFALGEFQGITLAGAQSAASGTWSGGTGNFHYSLIGHTCFLNVFLSNTTTSAVTGYVRLALPFTSTSPTIVVGQMFYSGAWRPVLIVLAAGTAYATIYGDMNTSVTIPAGSMNVRFECRYQVN